MKKNGFTFVELLAMLTVIGIIMLVAIPNISGMLKNQRLGSLKTDAMSMVEAAKSKASKDRLMLKPKVGECIVFPLNYLDDNENIIKGPNGGLYDQFDSIVVYTRVGNKYKYYVRLIEIYNNKKIGVSLIDSITIDSLKSGDISEINDNIGLTKNDNRSTAINKLESFASLTAKCNNVVGYYSGGNYCVYYNGIYYDDEGNQVSASRFEQVCS